jgi:integrase/recombinase XerD
MSTFVASAPEAPEPLSWESALDAYLLRLRASRRASLTVESYTQVLGGLRRFLIEHRSPTPGRVTVEHLRAYQVGLLTGSASRTGRPYAVRTVHRITTTIQGFFAFLEDEGRLPSDPAANLDRPRLPSPVPGDVLTVAEVERVLAAPDGSKPTGVRDRALVELLYATGLRRAEILALDLGDLRHPDREVVVRHGKGDKGRIVPIGRSAYHHVVTYLERARPALQSSHPDSARALFLSRVGRRLSRQQFQSVVKALGVRAGLSTSLSPHVLRRTFATHLLKGGVSLRHIQILLGHASLNTTAIYLRLDTRELRREILLHHPRERIDP